MPGTLTDDLEIIEAGHGGGTDIPAGGDNDDGGSGSGLPKIPERAYYTVVQLSLAGIVMFFMALTSSFLVRKGLGSDWVSFTLPRVLWVNTLLLVASSVTIQVALRQIREGAAAAFRQWWALTTALGLLFLVGQLLAWRQLAAQGVFLATNPSSSFFYVLTALHGIHLAGGIVGLLYVRFRPWQRSRIRQVTAAGMASIYWHFMDGLWLFLLALLYLGR
jgi:cytochrome c oxidase subunit III